MSLLDDAVIWIFLIGPNVELISSSRASAVSFGVAQTGDLFVFAADLLFRFAMIISLQILGVVGLDVDDGTAGIGACSDLPNDHHHSIILAFEAAERAFPIIGSPLILTA